MSPADYVLLPLLFLSQLVLCLGQHSSQSSNCSNCGRLGEIGYPFHRFEDASCGDLIAMNCTASEPKAQFNGGKWYPVKYIDFRKRRMEIHDEDLQSQLLSNCCDLLGNFSEQAYLNRFKEELPPGFLSFNITETRPFFKCKHKPNSPSTFFKNFDHYKCTGYDLYYKNKDESLPCLPGNLSDDCFVVQLPSARVPDTDRSDVKDKLTSHWGANFTIVWKNLQACIECFGEGGVCQRPANQSFQCYKKDESGKKGANVGGKIAIGLGTGFGSILLTCIAFIFYVRRKEKSRKEKRLSSSSALVSRDLFRDNSFKLEHEKGTILLQTQIFT